MDANTNKYLQAVNKLYVEVKSKNIFARNVGTNILSCKGHSNADSKIEPGRTHAVRTAEGQRHQTQTQRRIGRRHGRHFGDQA